MDKILENAIKLMKLGYVCDHCLGRIVAGQLLTSFDNERRGKALRDYIAMLLEAGEKIKLDFSNFAEYSFRNFKIPKAKRKKCFVCNSIFEELDKIAEKIANKIKKRRVEFTSFWIGSKISKEMGKVEEMIFSQIGIEFAETIKAEINRELGKKLEALLNKKAVEENPDITIVLDLQQNKVEIKIRSLFVLGYYKKLKRGFPQAKWVCPACKGKGCLNCEGKGKLYPTSIQEIIEKPFLKLAKAKKSKFSAAGREDIDARCLDWRPFVIEIVKPKIRSISLKEIEKQINSSKKVQVKLVRFVDKRIVRIVKNYKADKTYEALVTFNQSIDKNKLKQLENFFKNKTIRQATPLRVLHRRKDKIRLRKVKSVKAKIISQRKVLFRIKAESGLYIKELINGDLGRTKPNFADFLEAKPKKIVLDVVKIHFPKKLLR